MKRRDFLKILGMCVVAPGAVIAAIKAKPKQHIYAINYPGSGITNEQLRELIRATLKDLPQNSMNNIFYVFPLYRLYGLKHDKTPN